MAKLKIVSFNVNQFDGLYGHFSLYAKRYSKVDSILKKIGESTNAEVNFDAVLSYVSNMLMGKGDVLVILHEVKKGSANKFCDELEQKCVNAKTYNLTYDGKFRTIAVSNCEITPEEKDFVMIKIDSASLFLNRCRKFEYDGVKIFGIHAPSISQIDKDTKKEIITPDTFKEALNVKCCEEQTDIVIGDFNPQADWELSDLLDGYRLCEETELGGFNGITAYTDKRLDLAFLRSESTIKKYKFSVDYTPLKKKFSDHAAIILEIET